jgi:hypothetical protein
MSDDSIYMECFLFLKKKIKLARIEFLAFINNENSLLLLIQILIEFFNKLI